MHRSTQDSTLWTSYLLQLLIIGACRYLTEPSFSLVQFLLTRETPENYLLLLCEVLSNAKHVRREYGPDPSSATSRH